MSINEFDVEYLGIKDGNHEFLVRHRGDGHQVIVRANKEGWYYGEGGGPIHARAAYVWWHQQKQRPATQAQTQAAGQDQAQPSASGAQKAQASSPAQEQPKAEPSAPVQRTQAAPKASAGDLENLLGSILTVLVRIAEAIEALEAAPAQQAPVQQEECPNLDLPLELYPTFDWSSIGAEVIASDKHGPTMVRWSGRVYKRRSPLNKYGEVIIFSRATGVGEDGKQQYERLVRFRRQAQPDPLPDRVVAALTGSNGRVAVH
ncbi:MAG: hypothetical protein Kow0047_31200 [Anaerolineae bacterium]